ncbi:MAG: Holliday junction resolvase RuvX [Chitinophagaceae bacterium]
MSRIISIDYGKKRCGIAITDELQIIATPLETIHTEIIFPFLTNYFKKEKIEKIIIGLPYDLQHRPTHATPLVEKFISELKNKFPTCHILTIDERFTSKLALQAIVQSGKKKKERQNKGNLDKIAACILLENYLQMQEKNDSL